MYVLQFAKSSKFTACFIELPIFRAKCDSDNLDYEFLKFLLNKSQVHGTCFVFSMRFVRETHSIEVVHNPSPINNKTINNWKKRPQIYIRKIKVITRCLVLLSKYLESTLRKKVTFKRFNL